MQPRALITIFMFFFVKKRIKFLGNEIQQKESCFAKGHAVGSSCAINYKTKQNTLKLSDGF